MYSNDRVPDTMRAENNETYHLLYNHQGSLRAAVNEDGEIVKEVQYDAFGNITLDTNPDLHVHFGFAGGLYDQHTKLTRFGYRDYDALTGKWTAKDPIGFQGGDTNLYGYVLGDPVGFVDPEGLNPYIVYGVFIAGRLIYVGITKAWKARKLAHQKRFGKDIEMKPMQENLCKTDARKYEQGGIEYKGLENLENKINSIGSKNPKYSDYKNNQGEYQDPWTGL